jgi:hypothetical protein
MVAERYQHQQLLMLYDTWQENGGDLITVNPGNSKKRIMRPRRISEVVSEVKMLEPNISQNNISETSKDYLSQDSLIEEDMLHDIAKISSRSIDVKKGYMLTQERSMAATEMEFTYPVVDQDLAVKLS